MCAILECMLAVSKSEAEQLNMIIECVITGVYGEFMDKLTVDLKDAMNKVRTVM